MRSQSDADSDPLSQILRNKKAAQINRPAHLVHYLGLRATKAFPTIQTLVTGSVPHCDMAAIRASRRILLKMRDRIAQCLHFLGGWSMKGNGVQRGFRIEHIIVFR